MEVILKILVWLIRTPYRWLGYPRNITKFCGSVSAKKRNEFAKFEIDNFWMLGSTDHASITGGCLFSREKAVNDVNSHVGFCFLVGV